MRLLIHVLTIALFYQYMFAEMIEYDNNMERKELFYACLEEDQESCKVLITDGLPSEDECNPKTSCIAIGHVYTIAKDYKHALAYYQKSCNARIPQACFELALSYEKLGQYEDSQYEYERSCRLDFMPSCYNLAMMFVNGVGVPQDIKKANRLFMEACANDEFQSCYNLGISYRDGSGVKPNRLKAKELFKKSCDLGMNDGCKAFKLLDSANFNLTIPDHLNK
ncbi:tetratricopeptide repeat protein [Helicobacter didelphidarum]|nr:tetratricopeptide repeat protein [Helicobacter didelphidarum]